MILVIDGYNILKRQHGVQFVDEVVRKRFIHGLAGYARYSGNKVLVVFDGGAHDDAYDDYGRSVQVVYSGTRETADDYIKRYIKTHAHKDLMLVTSDRELNRIADRYEVPSLDAHEFVRVLTYSAQERAAGNTTLNAPIIKLSEEIIPELDEVMEQASKMVPQKSDDVGISDRRSVAQKISKKERELLKKVKKL
jgi:predicted RNA-binding protein with PIN domain